MSNATLILESLALIKDAKDRLDKVDCSELSEAGDALYVAGARLLLATAHKQTEALLHGRAGR